MRNGLQLLLRMDEERRLAPKEPRVAARCTRCGRDIYGWEQSGGFAKNAGGHSYCGRCCWEMMKDTEMKNDVQA